MPEEVKKGESPVTTSTPKSTEGGSVATDMTESNKPSSGEYIICGQNKLTDFDLDVIIADIAKRSRNGRRLFVPIGTSQSGKSMFIASLLCYKGVGSCEIHALSGDKRNKEIFDAITESVRKKGRTLSQTPEGMFTVIDVEMTVKKRGHAKVTFIDFAGEDIERMLDKKAYDTEEESAKNQMAATKKIMSILKTACTKYRAFFPLLSPIDVSFTTERKEESDYDMSQADAMAAFLNQLWDKEQNTYKKSMFAVVVTKWDILPVRRSPEWYLKTYRKQLYNSCRGKDITFFPYSAGDVQGNVITLLRETNAQVLWFRVFKWITGKHVLPWWKRLFS